MRRKHLLWQLFPPLLITILASLLLITAYSSRTLRHFYLEQTSRDLRARAILVEDQLTKLMMVHNRATIQTTCIRLSQATDTRLTVIQASGVVIADSEEDPEQMDNHADRPEIAQALAGETGQAVRFSYTLQQEMMYVAVPSGTTAPPDFVVRASLSLATLSDALKAVYWQMLLAGLVLALIASLIVYAVSRRLSRSIGSLREGAERFAHGDLDHRLKVLGTEEIGALADVMNTMAEQLDDRIKTVERQRNELEAVLGSMAEGVLAVNPEDRVISLNNAGARMLDIAPEHALGRSVQEVVRNPDLLDLIEHTLAGETRKNHTPVEKDIILHGEQELFLQAHGSNLHGAAGNQIGVLVVLNDVTRLRRLETVRRDFVANVSHELRTPITSVKGFVETLVDTPPQDKTERRRFLEIIANHADRLNAIIEDLLSLSRIEQEAEKTEIVLTDSLVSEVTLSALETCSGKAESRDIHIDHVCSGHAHAAMNQPLLEQAVINLVDNAIKYSEPGSRIRIECRTEGENVYISVQDEGWGIAAEHLPRLFERFYRVDKARSRKLGGTGLGLAIVKHIVQAHSGEVTVESALGQGSTFTIRLPR